MEIIKGLLLILLFGASSIIGLLLSKKYKDRVIDLKEIKNALNVLETKMRFTYEPIPEIFVEIGQTSKKPISDIFISASNQMETYTAGEAWDKSLDKIQTSMKQDDIAIIKGLSKMLGKTDLEGQVSEITLTSKFLDTQIAEAEQEKIKNEKMYKTLGMITGLALVVVLI